MIIRLRREKALPEHVQEDLDRMKGTLSLARVFRIPGVANIADS